MAIIDQPIPGAPIPIRAASRHQPAQRAVVLLVGLIVLAALVAAIASMRLGTANHRVARSTPAPVAAAVRAAPPPLPEPIVRGDLTPDQARASNAAVPFASGPIAAARAFDYPGAPTDRAAARTCLAAALLYEAGDDKPGEQAVAQVVLNRLRHPAFPKTVCGVVFQGSERTTGCQFTFTCDGALARTLRPDAWARARAIADAALGGFVFKPVGTATHYHTDWVVPYWRDTLEKVAQVHTQIFYRWPGWWGGRGALSGGVQAPERMDPRILVLAGPAADMAADAPVDAQAPALPPRASLAIEGVPTPALKGSIVRLMDPAASQYVLQLDPGAFAGGWAVVGFTICGARPDCIVMGWTAESETPRALPVPPEANRSMAFLYRKSSALGLAQPYWDCRRFPRADTSQCLPGSAPSS